MSRNLLPRLRQTPNPANVPPARVGEWTELSTPGALAQLDFGPPDDHIRTRIQSIPSPWARMLLFKNAFEEDGHPARMLVQSDLLDAFEFLWSLKGRAGAPPEFRTIQVSNIEQLAKRQASQRVERFARALLELIPRRTNDALDPSFESITIVLIDGRPILATSPYTVLLTSVDAAAAKLGSFFAYGRGDRYRPLRDRPQAFQRYVARVLLPQLGDVQAISDSNTDGAEVLRLLKPWLDDEVREAQSAAGRQMPELESPSNGDWEASARLLALTRISDLRSGIALFTREAGAQVSDSRWRLLPTRKDVKVAPLVLHEGSFDGTYFPGASKVNLPANLVELDRQVLPVNDTRYPWVCPLNDWFADRIISLSQPLDTANVLGFDSFTSAYRGEKEYLRTPQFTLPLRSDPFRYFSPEEIAKRLNIDVQSDGRIAVSLRIPVGNESQLQELVIRRTYDETSVHDATGPSLAVWPRFRSESWHLYTLFRRDLNANVAEYFKVTGSLGGQALEATEEQRNDFVRVASFKGAPEVLEFVSTVAARPGSGHLGVILPRYRQPQAPMQTKVHVGIDFGTSNTVVSLRTDSGQGRSIFGVKELTLPLTRIDSESSAQSDAYFLPHSMRAAPFGTAVMRFERLLNQNIMSEPVGVRINIPFSGFVQSDAHNRVVGDLKWSANADQQFLSAAFLRHLLVVIAADAVQQGTPLSNISVSWAYPRSFTESQVNVMRLLWSQVGESMAEMGMAIGDIAEAVDESRAVLRHFFSAGILGPAGEMSAIIDVGGGTSDIAVYGEGRTILLDSVVLGGRNLTGAKLQGSTAADLANPFVGSFVRWSASRQLEDYPLEAQAVEKYRADGQDHLAFSYLMQTKWFRLHGKQFSGDEAFHRFQALVLYFSGALFYYLGMALRGDGKAPRLVMLAGNGSRYMNWLTDLVPGASHSKFSKVLGRLLLAGLGDVPNTELPDVRLTETPKEEVALGLVAPVRVDDLAETGADQDSVIGESVRYRPRAAEPETSLEATTRLGTDLIPEAAQAATLKWGSGPMEIERFHDALLREAAELTGYGAQWRTNVSRMRTLFGKVSGARIQDLTRNRLQYLATLHHGFRGSLFVLEAGVILEQMLTESFASRSDRVYVEADERPASSRM
jgi:hypothetical protein